MKKTKFLFLGFIMMSAFNVSQKHFRINEFHFTDNVELSKFISLKSRFDHSHPFIEFVDSYKHVAIKCQIEYGIPVSIQLAQAIVESGGGKSELGKVANNLFGMKYYKEIFSGDYITANDGTKWRKYPSFKESFEDHAKFLNKYYNHAVDKNWEFWINNCKGYGGPGYWNHIGKVIKNYKLYEYDDMVVSSLKMKV